MLTLHSARLSMIFIFKYLAVSILSIALAKAVPNTTCFNHHAPIDNTPNEDPQHNRHLHITSICIMRRLYGTFPRNVFRYPNLKKLNLSENNLYGELPFQLNTLSLSHVNLNYNHFTGEIPGPSLGLNTSLQTLEVAYNTFQFFDARFFKKTPGAVRKIFVRVTGNPFIQFFGPDCEDIQIILNASEPIMFYAPAFQTPQSLRHITNIGKNPYIKTIHNNPLLVQFIGNIPPFLKNKNITHDTIIQIQ